MPDVSAEPGGGVVVSALPNVVREELVVVYERTGPLCGEQIFWRPRITVIQKQF